MQTQEANDRDLSGFPRLVDQDPLKDAAWEQLGWSTYNECNRRLKKQKRENFFKWVMLCATVVIVIVLALVWAGQLHGAAKPYASTRLVGHGKVVVKCLNGGDPTIYGRQEVFGELVVSCGE